jgi:DNA-binding PadR family transcriptional regulator
VSPVHAIHSLTQLAAALQHAGHPLRLVILGHLVSGPASPNELFKRLAGGDHGELTLGQLAYHFRQLNQEGKIRLARKEPVRGTHEHFYELADPGCELLQALGVTGEPLRDYMTRGLRERGWNVDGYGYVDPEGNEHLSLAAALEAQTVREIAAGPERCGCLPAPEGPDGRVLIDIQAEVERRAQAMKAGPYELPDDEDWAIFSAGTGLTLAEMLRAAENYVQRWLAPDVAPEQAVAGAYICGILVGELRASGGWRAEPEVAG